MTPTIETKTHCAAHDLARDLDLPRVMVESAAKFMAALKLDKEIARRIKMIGRRRETSQCQSK